MNITMGEKQDKDTLERENMTKLSENAAKPEKRGVFLVNIQLILLGAIVLVIGFSAFRLYKWNKGTPSDYDPNYQTTDFDIETLDNLIPLAPDKREGYVDDGVTTILCLGDDPFSLERGENGLAEQIAKKREPRFTTALSREPPWRHSLPPTTTATFWTLSPSPTWQRALRAGISI